MSQQSKVRIGPLQTVGNVATELGRVYRQMRRNELDKQDGERLARVLTMLRQTLEVGEIEQRLADLEAKDNRK